MGWYRHDAAGPIGVQHIVSDIDRDFLPVDRIDRISAGKDAGAFPNRGKPLDLADLLGLFDIPCHLIPLFGCHEIHHALPFGGEHDK